MNDDCWLEVINVLALSPSTRDMWHLMQVCRILYTLGMPILVRLWSNGLSSESRYDPECVDRFCKFMLSGDGERLKQLRKFDVADIVGSHMWDRPLLFRVVDNATSLEELEMDGDLFFAYVQAFDTPRHFEHLAVLTVRSANDIGDALGRVRAPLARLTLDFDDVDDELEDEDEELPDCVSLILPFRDTLTELNVINGWLDNALDTVTFNRLTCLQLENTFIPPVGQLAHAFPNLKQLEAIFCFGDEEDDEFRASNEDSQAEGDTWHHLDVVSVHRPGFLYGLALTCTARCMAFEYVDGPEEVDLAASLLSIMHPKCLRVGSRSVQTLAGIFTPLAGVASGISELHVLVDMTHEGGRSSVLTDIAIDSVVFACATLHLTHFMLTVFAPQVRDNLPLTDLGRYISTYNLSELAHRLMVTVPTLEFMRLCFTRQHRAYWQVTEVADGPRQLQSISKAHGDSITRSIFPIASRAEAEFFKD
ncbi:hypothetical protein BDY19DRAFT_204569 [Irpex rosettiformis]|uniref:Uncharacterized protein n=1 Tax=Irpex rosettiformis TaxID=378272 RepID=A0ACB8U147_9APHY|nr:hypothetical protein BDY19DRAFT_204569 [Irpex rosettiformis]